MTPEQRALCRRVLSVHSKSFALAAKLLPPDCQDDAAVVYAWCRHADDSVDLAAAGKPEAALRQLRDGLDEVYSESPPADPVLGAFREVARRRAIPRDYPEELLSGMEMDAAGTDYDSMDRLLLYCFRVAGTVGLMMCHVLGVDDPIATRHAAHLGMAMQLTNICRDVVEDWNRERLYIPDTVLQEHGGGDLRSKLGAPLPATASGALAGSVRHLLGVADQFYRSGDQGLPLLGWRSAFAVRTARLVYSRIGQQLERRGCDVFSGRAYVPRRAKLRLVLRALVLAAAEAPARQQRPFVRIPLCNVVRYPTDVLPV